MVASAGSSYLSGRRLVLAAIVASASGVVQGEFACQTLCDLHPLARFPRVRSHVLGVAYESP
jgi:hypothetical protein